MQASSETQVPPGSWAGAESCDIVASSIPPRLASMKDSPETISDLGAGVPTGTFTVFPGCAGLLIGFAHTLFDEKALESS
jgi:hypothetical protein